MRFANFSLGRRQPKLETHLTIGRDKPCIHGTRDRIFSMHGASAGRRQ